MSFSYRNAKVVFVTDRIILFTQKAFWFDNKNRVKTVLLFQSAKKKKRAINIYFNSFSVKNLFNKNPNLS